MGAEYQTETGYARWEDKAQYIERVSRIFTKEMKPFLHDLVEPCACSWKECTGWKLKTMLRSALPLDALTKHSHRK